MTTKTNIRLLLHCCCLALGILLAAPSTCVAKGSSYQFRHYDTQQGLSHNSVLAIAQDSMGFMWFGTHDGLSRFDGHSFKVYHKSMQPHGLGNGRIGVISQAPDHQLWVGTEHGVYIYSPVTDSFRRFDVQATDGSRVTGEVHVITGNADCMIIGCISGGVYVYDLHSGRLTHHSLEGYPTVSSISIDAAQTIWIGFYEGGLAYTRNLFKTIVPFKDGSGQTVLRNQTITGMVTTEKGLLYLCSSTSGLSELNISEKVVTPLISPADGTRIYGHSMIQSDDELLVATENGLYAYNLDDRSYSHYTYESTDPFSLSDKSLQTVFRDKDGGIWVGSYFGGVNYAPRMSYAFSNYIPRVDRPGSLSGRRVGQMVEAADGTVWVGTEDGGLSRFSPATSQFTFVDASRSFLNVQSLCMVGDQLWVGTFAHGLQVLDAATGRLLRTYQHGEDKSGQLYDNNIFSIAQTSDGSVYVGTLGGLYRYEPSTDQFFLLEELPKHIVYDIMEDHAHNLWVAVYDNGIYMRRAGSNQWQCFAEDFSTLPANNVVGLYETSHGDLWAITDGNGASRYDSARQRFLSVPIPNYQPKRVLQGMVEDSEGLLWLTCNEGLICYNPENAATRIYTTDNGLLNNSFSRHSALCSSTGLIYLGCQSGLVTFSPESFLGLSSAPAIVATELMLQGRVVDNYAPDSPLKQSITATRQLTLPYDQNSLVIKIAVLSYRDAQTRHIKYMLEGFDSQWQHLYSDNYIRYTNLPPGDYVLRVCDMTNNEKTAIPLTIDITIRQPWYNTWWAWLIYILVAAGAILMAYRYLTQRSRLNRQLAMEKFEHEQQQELYQSKINFFTNVAHEIRTPLTLIKGPLTDILQKDVSDETDRENLHIMDQNVTRLLNLTNQLLDFRKIERDGLRLSFQRCNIGQLVSDVYVRFKPIMQQRGISATISLPEEPLQAYVDSEAFTKIVSNLMTNATKYCDHIIKVELSRHDDQVRLITRNDGPLIPPTLRQQIFLPFYRAETAEGQTGTGIGMALARSLAELHSGNLDILDDDTLNVFCLTLPIEQKEFFPSADDAGEEQADTAEPSVAESDEQQPQVLIVEDNASLKAYEKKHLSHHYRVLTADNGQQALQVLADNEVDIIVSDIMMEPIDGFELCRQVKEDVNTSHIPFILLTALTLDSAKVEGMESGADSYIEKPFSMDYLLSVIQNLLRSRQSIKQAYASSPFLLQESVSISKTDKEFMQRLEAVMADHLTDSDFDINEMARLLFMSRTNLNRKMRGLFNLTPNNYIKVERLKRAAQLLKQGDSRVNEVCYMVGFSSPSYFTQCFQKQFGLLPKDFIVQQNG